MICRAADSNEHIIINKYYCRSLRPFVNMHAVFGRSDFKIMFFPEIIKERGLEHVTVEDLVAEITPKGRGMFPI